VAIDTGSTKLTPAQYQQRLDNVKAIAARRKAKTHCINGHPLSGDNVRFRENGKRNCKACQDINAKINRNIKKARILSDPDYYLHGTRQGYSLGCRCFKCRYALWELNSRLWRERGKCS